MESRGVGPLQDSGREGPRLRGLILAAQLSGRWNGAVSTPHLEIEDPSGRRRAELAGALHLAADGGDLPLPAAQASALVAGLETDPPRQLAGLEVSGIENLDGIKLLLGEDGWIMARPSGTEPVLRLYCEARTPEMVEQLLQALGNHLEL